MKEMLELDKDEKILLVIKRSLIGLVPVFLAGLLLCAAFFSGVFMLGRFRDEVTSVLPLSMAFGVVGLVAVMVVVILYVAIWIYTHNKLIVTNESLVQVLQHSLFNKLTSQLSLANVQDVTVHQPGFVAHLFNYGTLIIETAGEQSNFSFKYAKNPTEAARVIIDAHEVLVPKG